MYLVKNALLPYQNKLRNISSDTITEAHNVYGFCKSKVLYSLLLNNITANIPSTTKFLRQCCATDDVNYIFTKKVSLEREIKLREFNFKVLHGILPCNKNLKQWKIKISDHCDVCGQIQTIEHLLWSCRYVQSLWKIVEDVLEVNLDFNMILGIRDNCEHPYVLTLVSFLIYKEWLVLSLENKFRSDEIVLEVFKHELMLRQKIYEKCEIYSYIELYVIERLIDRL